MLSTLAFSVIEKILLFIQVDVEELFVLIQACFPII